MLEFGVTVIVYILTILLSSFLIRVLKISTYRQDRKIAGVCAGLSRASDMPVWMIRIFFFVFIIFAGYGIILYISLWLFMRKGF